MGNLFSRTMQLVSILNQCVNNTHTHTQRKTYILPRENKQTNKQKQHTGSQKTKQNNNNNKPLNVKSFGDYTIVAIKNHNPSEIKNKQTKSFVVSKRQKCYCTRGFEQITGRITYVPLLVRLAGGVRCFQN